MNKQEIQDRITFTTGLLSGMLLRHAGELEDSFGIISLLPVPPNRMLIRFRSGLVLRATVELGSLDDLTHTTARKIS